MLHVQRIREMTKRIIHTTYPNLVFIGSVCGIKEKIGLEGLELIVSNGGALPCRQLNRRSNLDILVDIHVECSIEWFAAHRDVSIMPEWYLRGGAHTTDNDFP